MAYDFPASPTPGQEYTPPVGGQTYVYQPPRWLVKGVPPAGGGGGGGIAEAPVDTKQYGRQDAAWSEVIANPTWSTLTGKPSTFPPTLPIAESDVTNLVTDLAAKEPTIAAGTAAQYWKGTKVWATLDKAAVGLSNVDNTSDASKPVSTAQAAADATKEPTITGGTTAQWWRGDKSWQALPATDWTAITSKPATFPPTLPIASSGVTGLDTAQAAQDTAIGTKLDASAYTAADVLTKTKGVDGAGSGLDADLLDGQEGTYYLAWGNFTGKPSTFPPTLPIAESDVTNLVTDLGLKAPLASPSLTGTPLAPTATAGTNTTQIASTAFVGAAIAAAPSGAVTISDTAPGSPTNGMLWWQSSTGDLFIYYNDGTSSQWVQINA